MENIVKKFINTIGDIIMAGVYRVVGWVSWRRG